MLLPLFLVLAALVPSTFEATCRPQEYLDPSGKYCYVYNNRVTTFENAEAGCHAYGGYKLAKIMDMTENKFVYGLIQRSGDAWLGATDNTDDGSWKWLDGTPMTFVNWAPSFKEGSCLVMRYRDGQWLRGSCDASLPSVCYGPAQGAITDAPPTPLPTTKPLFHTGQYIFFAGDTDYMGTPNHAVASRAAYTKQRDLIMAVADNAFKNNAYGDSVCDVWADYDFYGWAPVQEGFSLGNPQRQNSFDLSLSMLDFTNNNNYQMNNITTAIQQLKTFHWYPLPQEINYTTLVFFTGQLNFQDVPSLFDPWPNVDEILVVLMNGSTMQVPNNNPRIRQVRISAAFSADDVKKVSDLLKCNM